MKELRAIKEELSNLKMLDSLNMKPFHYKVLVVDDEEPVKRLIVTLLSQKGHQCIAAGSGLEALEKIEKNKFDAVVADIVMPEMDGLTLTRELSKHDQSPPVPGKICLSPKLQRLPFESRRIKKD